MAILKEIKKLNNLKYSNSKHFDLEQISDGVYAAIAIKGTGSVGNAGIVDLGNATLIFDTFNTQQAALDLRKAAGELTDRAPQYVVNSHWHGDHIRGNQVFEDSTIIATNTTYELMKSIHPERIQKQIDGLLEIESYITSLREKLEAAPDEQSKLVIADEISGIQEIVLSLPTLKLTLPSLLFDTKLTLHGTKRYVELRSVGAAHTIDDTILYIPNDQILFAADTVLVDNHPMMLNGDPEHWIVVLDEISELPIKKLVPGHGQVGTFEAANKLKDYLQQLFHIVDSHIVSGQAVEALNSTPIPLEFVEWKVDQFFYNNLRFMYERKMTV